MPQEIGPYRVVRPLGQGGMGTVYLADDPRLARRVALKTFTGPAARSDYAREQVLAEARAAAGLTHPNIASVHDVLDVEGQVVIVFEYVEGETLASRLARGPLTVRASLAIAVQLADAVAAAHAQGIVHRDLKPGNVIITADGLAKVLDFGIARVLPADPAAYTKAQTTSAVFVGTVGYAAPEQCLGQPVDARADVFSLSVVLFEMLTGERPFPGHDAATVIRAMLQSDPPHVAGKRPDVPPALDSLIVRGLSRTPADRPQTVGEFREGLRALAPTDVHASAVAPRRRTWITAAMLASALATGILVSSLIPGRLPAPNAEPPAKPPVVAVMPLINASGDAGNDYLAVGVAESLITRLAALPSITVLSRSAVADVRSRHGDLPTLAAELDATYLVDGSVQRAGDLLAITLTLVRPDRSVAWAETVEGSFEEIFEMQTRLASALAQGLVVQLSAADRVSLAQQPTLDADAQNAYWRGRALLDRRDLRGNVDSALAAFDEAVRLDPRFADAHAARGEALWARYGETNDPAWAQHAIQAGNEALRLGPQRPHVRYSLALTLEGSGKLDEAVEELQRALALQPNYDDARRRLGQVLARQGRVDEAVAEFRKAIALRPGYWGHHSALGFTLFQAARYQEAIAAFDQVVRLQPDSPFGHQQLGAVYQAMGDYDQAIAHFRKSISISPLAQAYSGMGGVLHQRGDYAGAVDAYRQALVLRPNSHITKRNLGDALTRLGDRAAARRAYEDAVALVERDLTLNPREPRNLAYLAVYLAKLGRLDAARARIDEAVHLAGRDVQVVYRSAVVSALSGRVPEALDRLEHAVALGYSRKAAAEDEDFEILRAAARFRTVVADSQNGGPK